MTSALSLALSPSARATADDPVACQGVERAGGIVICVIPLDASLSYERWSALRPDSRGRVLLGFDRDDRGFQQIVYGRPTEGAVWSNLSLEFEDGVEYAADSFDIWKTRSAEWQSARIADDLAPADGSPFPLHFEDGFHAPLDVDPSGVCEDGGVRYRPSAGRIVSAPASGQFVGMARDTAVIDHGQGLFSMLSGVEGDATPRDITRGDAVGMTQGAPGREVCWRAVWRGNVLDPLLNIDFPDRLSYDEFFASWEAASVQTP